MNRNKEKVLQRNRTNWMCMLAEGRMFKGQSLIKGNLVVRLSRAKGMLEKKFDHSLNSEISREVEFLSNQRLLLSFQRFQLKPRLSNGQTPHSMQSLFIEIIITLYHIFIITCGQLTKHPGNIA